VEEYGFDLDQKIIALAEARAAEARAQLIAEIRSGLETGIVNPGRSGRKRLTALLYIQDAYIRYEVAQLLFDYQGDLKPADLLQYYFASQNFQKLWDLARTDTTAKALLFSGFLDRNLRLRTKLLKLIHESDCSTPAEKIFYHYGRAAYEELYELYLSSGPDEKQSIQDILKQGLKTEWNTDYHRRACAALLEQLEAGENLQQEIEEILKKTPKEKNTAPLRLNTIMPEPATEFGLFLEKLNRQGIYTNGQIIYPEIQIGTKTGRVTYRNPGLQTWSEEKREQDILSPPGCEIIRFDYQSIEPAILANLLLNEHLISFELAQTEDIYLAIFPQDRSRAKKYMNAFINGGPALPPFNPQPVLWQLVQAIDTYRSELVERWQKGENLQTIGGNSIILDEKEPNRGGKLMNRMIQGGAADFFNTAVLRLDQYLVKNKVEAGIYFLLYDEVWLSAKKEIALHVGRISQEILEGIYQIFNFLIPVKVRRLEK